MSDIGEVLLKSALHWQKHAPVPPALNVFWDANPSCGMLAGFATKTQKPSDFEPISTKSLEFVGVYSKLLMYGYSHTEAGSSKATPDLN